MIGSKIFQRLRKWYRDLRNQQIANRRANYLLLAHIPPVCGTAGRLTGLKHIRRLWRKGFHPIVALFHTSTINCEANGVDLNECWCRKVLRDDQGEMKPVSPEVLKRQLLGKRAGGFSFYLSIQHTCANCQNQTDS